MAALSRFGPSVIKSTLLHHQRHMASVTPVSDPIQRLFLEKIKEFKATNKGLDDAHQKAMSEEVLRLQRVYKVDEAKLTQIECKFPNETTVSLRDLDESKELRQKIMSGEYRKQLAVKETPKSAIIASVPPQERIDMHLPPLNKPDPRLVESGDVSFPKPAVIEGTRPDYEVVGEKATPQSIMQVMKVDFGPNMPTIHDDESPERDTVNFPRIKQHLDTPPTRFHCVPESWFQIFYPKTGVSGPYVFGGGLLTFLFSKEWFIMEHEMISCISAVFLFSWLVTKYGPTVRPFFVNKIKDMNEGWEHWRTGNIDVLDRLQKHYKEQLGDEKRIEDLYAIRRQDIENQLELEYRSRLNSVYQDVKRRLNYLVSLNDSQRQIAQKNMVNWVITNSVSSIGPKQESEVLDNCITNLKQMSTKYAKSI